MEGISMELKTMKIHEIKGSCLVYIPIVWVRRENLKKGDLVIWTVDEGNHDTLHLKKKLENK